MNITKFENGDVELGDYKAKIDPDGLNIVWAVTHHCFLKCPYCVGWKLSGEPNSLFKKYKASEIIDSLESLSKTYNKNIYITLTGGEPLIIKEIPEFCQQAASKNIKFDLQTNLLSNNVTNFLDNVPPDCILQIMTCYHDWKLDQDNNLRQIFFKNCRTAMDKGFTLAVKLIARPDKIHNLKNKKDEIQNELGQNAIIMPVAYMHGSPVSLNNFNRAFPYSYSLEQRKILDECTEYRKQTQKDYILGAGFFNGMLCDAGNSYVYMDIDGNVSRCGSYADSPLGNLMSKNIKLKNSSEICKKYFCSCPPWGMWYGINPWDYIPGAKKENANYCRFKNV